MTSESVTTGEAVSAEIALVVPSSKVDLRNCTLAVDCRL